MPAKIILPTPEPESESSSASRERNISLAAALIILLITVVYANSFHGAFVYDDLPSIVANDSLHSLPQSLVPRTGYGYTVEGRPLLNFSFAINFAVGGVAPWSYHLTNLLIHIGASLALFGVMRRTLVRLAGPAQREIDALLLSLATTLLWALHPLQTSAVTYVVQRAESLCGLFYLLTLYGFLRYAYAPAARLRWLALAALSCLDGMATKEVMVTAPLLVLAYDRLFLSDSWRTAWKSHGRLHVLLFATWGLLAALVCTGHFRGGTVGFDQINAWRYFCTQLGAIVHYLRLALWPQPLVFDYGRATVSGLIAVWPAALLVLVLGSATVLGTFKRWPAAFAGLWFFLILSPSSSLLPIATETIAEHRMYLPLAAVIAAALLFIQRWLGRTIALLFAFSSICAAGILTHQRNEIYASPLALWEDTVRKAPDNARAHLNYGAELLLHGDLAGATRHFRDAVRLEPGNSDAHNNLAEAFRRHGDHAEALQHYAEAIRLDPANHLALSNRGAVLAAEGKLAEAEQSYAQAIAAGADASVRVEWAKILARLGREPEAGRVLKEALQHDPRLAAGHLALGQLLARQGQRAAAESAFRTAIELSPVSAEAHNSLGYLLLLNHQTEDALTEFATAVRQAPQHAGYRANFGVALARCNRPDEARDQLARALQLDPTNELANAMLQELKSVQTKPPGL